jgi:hypothetical protein
MAQVSITDVVVPAEFTAYQVENSMVSISQHGTIWSLRIPIQK